MKIFKSYRNEMKKKQMQKMLDRTAGLRKTMDHITGGDRILQAEELDEFFRNSMNIYNAM